MSREELSQQSPCPRACREFKRLQPAAPDACSKIIHERQSRHLESKGISPVTICLVYFVYIVRCVDGTLYTGYALDPQEREKVHNSGRGAKYTAGRRPVRLVYSEAFESLTDALQRECELKCWTRKQKEALIAGNLAQLKRL